MYCLSFAVVLSTLQYLVFTYSLFLIQIKAKIKEYRQIGIKTN